MSFKKSEARGTIVQSYCTECNRPLWVGTAQSRTEKVRVESTDRRVVEAKINEWLEEQWRQGTIR